MAAGCGMSSGTDREWDGSADFDPAFEQCDFGLGELMLRGHLEVLIGITDRFDQETFFHFAGNDDWARLASFQNVIAGIEAEAAFEFFGLGAVAFVTTG